MVKTWTKALLMFDVHVPDHDKKALALVKDFADDFKPDIVIAGGDWQNCDQVSTYPNETDLDIQDEFEQTEELIETFGVTDWMEGNHEQRLRRPGSPHRWLRKSLDPVRNLHLRERGINVFPYHKKKGVKKLGKLKVLHGFWCNKYAAATHSLAYGCCAFGHTHRFQTFSPKQAFESSTGFNVGCLSKLDLPYTAAKPPNGWVQGFAFVYIHKSGQFSFNNVRLIGNNFVINGKEYKR